MNIDLLGKSFCAFGLRGTGKTKLLHAVASSFGQSGFIFDTLNEIPPTAVYDSYPPKIRGNLVELSRVITWAWKFRKYRFIGIDETNRYAPSKPSPLPQIMMDLNDWHRHIPQCCVGYIARRPTQLNQDITELADYLFIFQLKGKNDIKYLNELASGAGDMVPELPPFHYLTILPDRSYTVTAPVPMT